MKDILNKVIAYLLYAFRFILYPINEYFRIKVGKIIGRILILISKKRKNITKRNIDLIYPNKLKYEKKNILVKSYENLGITLVELLVIDKYTDEELSKKINFVNFELIEDALKENNGLILLSGHYGNWELLAYAAGKRLNKTINIIVKSQNNRYADKFLKELRKSSGNELIDMKQAVKKIIPLLKENKIIALLADQRASKEKDLVTNFLGKPAANFDSTAVLAIKYNTPIITGFAKRNPDFTYTVTLNRMKIDSQEFSKYNIKKVTELYIKNLEKAIHERPDLWAWQHKKWEL